MIKHSQYENGVKDVFRLKVVSGQYAGIYDIKKPVGFDDFDCIVDIDKEFFNINNLVIGETEKITFMEYYDPKTFDLVKNVYEEQGGDGIIVFYWQKQKGTEIYDLLEENYALNLNKYKESFDQSRKKIELEIKKRDDQNLLLTREETSVNLFATKNLDENTITPVTSTEILYKEGGRTFSNFYFFSITRAVGEDQMTWLKNTDTWFPVFNRTDDYQFGDNTNIEVGFYDTPRERKYFGDPLTVISPLNNLYLEISNLNIYTGQVFPPAATQPFKLVVIKIENGQEYERIDNMINSVYDDDFKGQGIKIKNETFNIGSLRANSSLRILFIASAPTQWFIPNTEASFELRTKIISPIRKAKAVLLKDAVTQLCKQYTSGKMALQSSLIDNGGKYEKTAVSSGLFLRGISNIYLGQEKFTTSLKALFQDAVAPLMALGYDLYGQDLIIEDINYFFKNIQAYDFSNKEFIQEGFSIENDSELTYNNLIFGTKKYSTKNKDDIKNFNTSMEVSTPIKSIKNKLDKTADCIIDDKKIQELILDTTTATNDNDDDAVIIDLVNLESFSDEGVLTDCGHRNEDGYLWIYCYSTPIDTLPLSVGDYLTITYGFNVGTWQILEIDKQKAKLNKTSGIQEGITDTVVTFTLTNITKNRTFEGFTNLFGIDDIKAAVNIRHNPKYQMARWFPFFGGGMISKLDNENLIVSDYKNNGEVSLQWDSDDLNNELPGLVTLEQNEGLGRMRVFKTPFFNGKKINITLRDVNFDEFFAFLTNWRKGIDGDRMKSRGFITVKVDGKLMNIYPFGEKSISFSMKYNELKISGKIKNIYYDDDKFRYFDRYHDSFFE